MVDLSVIILSFNTRQITKDCLDSLIKALTGQKINTEIIVVDNASVDGSPATLKTYAKRISQNVVFKLILNKENVGYPKGNNQGLKKAQGRYVLFLNSDVIVENVDFDDLITYLGENKDVGALTVRVNLPKGGIDPASHRGFPTLWNSFCYFSKLERALGKIPMLSKVFGGYHLTYLNLNKTHEIDSPTGAFYLTRGDILKDIGGFDDLSFFMYGEDLDLSMRIKNKGYKIIYYPKYSVLHLKYASGLKASAVTRKKTKEYFYDAMKTFYKKHYEKKYPGFVSRLVYFAIERKSRS